MEAFGFEVASKLLRYDMFVHSSIKSTIHPLRRLEDMKVPQTLKNGTRLASLLRKMIHCNKKVTIICERVDHGK